MEPVWGKERFAHKAVNAVDIHVEEEDEKEDEEKEEEEEKEEAEEVYRDGKGV